MYGIIYQYTNTLSGLIYVGQTIEPARRLRQYTREVASNRSNPRLIIQAMQHAGLDAFTYQVLAEATTADELTRLEIHFIATLQANDPQYGYNRTTGGQCGAVGRICSAETKAKMSLAKRGKIGRICSAETKAKIGLASRSRICSAETKAKIGLASRGRTCSDETKAKMSQAHRDHTVSDETRAKLSQTGLGRIHSAETKAKMSLAKRGKTLSVEHKAKIAQAMRGRGRRAIKKITPVVHMCVEEGQA